ncbi:DedA family protein [Desulfosporosinus sp. PR]|uniref:DedA family protein n=1 Tax=Candidatus Desulfosporosinus nitrosoreducens TaxID=3401928 RepID=UPI0027FB86E4|nr:DedA family protein [Desulfosporosinus sp. PR]MDQ7097083.1 DedA family protein [Desulfosporosinus sp. PR]
MSSGILIHHVIQYGYVGLYVILLLSILGIPLPDEFLLTYVGFLSFSGQLNPILSILASALGSITGITLAYILGLLFEAKVLSYLKKHAGGKRLEKVLNWYHRHGGKLLTVGYFIPGVRHLSGYIAGLSRLEYRNFAFFSYIGALLWTTLFIVLGRSLGSGWKLILRILHRYSLLLGVIGVVIFLGFYLTYKNHERWGAWLTDIARRLSDRYMSLGKRRLLSAVGGGIFLTLFILLMSLIQDFVSHDVAEFDEFVASWLKFISPPWIIRLMQHINALGTYVVIFGVYLISVVILGRVTKRWAHILPLTLAWGGGAIIDHLFRFVFRGENINVFENIVPFQVPNTGFLLAGLSFYAVLGYIIGRESPRLIQLLLLVGELLLMTLLGLSLIFLQIHTPSAVVTALTVGCLWALVCVFLYEFNLFRHKGGCR